MRSKDAETSIQWIRLRFVRRENALKSLPSQTIQSLHSRRSKLMTAVPLNFKRHVFFVELSTIVYETINRGKRYSHRHSIHLVSWFFMVFSSHVATSSQPLFNAIIQESLVKLGYRTSGARFTGAHPGRMRGFRRRFHRHRKYRGQRKAAAE